MSRFWKTAALLAAILAAPVLLAGCGQKAHTQKHVVKQLTDADGNHRYAYQSDDGFWWYYMVAMNSSNSSSSTSSTSRPGPSLTSGGSIRVPPGGTWTKSNQAPKDEEVTAQEEEEISVNEEGTEPEANTPAEEAAPEATTPTETTPTETTPTESAPVESAPVESAPSDGGAAASSDGD